MLSSSVVYRVELDVSMASYTAFLSLRSILSSIQDFGAANSITWWIGLATTIRSALGNTQRIFRTLQMRFLNFMKHFHPSLIYFLLRYDSPYVFKNKQPKKKTFVDSHFQINLFVEKHSFVFFCFLFTVVSGIPSTPFNGGVLLGPLPLVTSAPLGSVPNPH